ncbi:MAG TPA: hypothetical protein ENN46_03900 [Candidatus Woesearchaeota archaeon]|nr:hypothetical protein [Candidatus Woesearchaeota archaeon]
MRKSDLESSIRKDLAAGKLILGNREVERGIYNNSVSKVIAASNTDETILRQVSQLCSTSGVEFLHSALSNTQLGILCKRQHTISVIGFKK